VGLGEEDKAMKTIKGRVKAGHLELDEPIEWPEGTPIEIRPVDAADNGDALMTPEEIAGILAAMDRVEPFEMTATEQAELESWGRKVKEHSIKNIDKDIEDVFP
jgi:hypothetical protein